MAFLRELRRMAMTREQRSRLPCAVLAAIITSVVMPTSAQVNWPSPVGMNDLLMKYEEYGLPLAPKEAKLVRVVLSESRWTASEGKSIDCHTVGFLLKEKTSWELPEVLIGTVKSRSRFIGVEAQSPTQLKADDFCAIVHHTGEETGAPFDINAGLATAMQCLDRGYTNLAHQLWNASVKESIPWQRRNLPDPSLLPSLAWTHLLNELVRPDSDRGLITRRMKALLKEESTLNTEENRKLIEDLEAALAPPKASRSKIAARIDELVELSHRFPPQHERSFMKGRPEQYFAFAPFGFDAIPELMNHLSDGRLTRSGQQGFNNFPTYIRRVNQIVTDILQDLASDDLRQDSPGYPLNPAIVAEWFKAASAEGEENFLTRRALADERYEAKQNRYMLLVLAHKYPNRLVAMYRKVLGDKEAESDLLAEAVSLSTLPQKEKLSVLLEASTNAVWWHQSAALSHMRNVDKGGFKKLLIEKLREAPTAPAKHPTIEGNIAYLVIKAEDQQVWKTLTEAARRADSEFKADAMWAMCNPGPGAKQHAERAQFLESLLDDRAKVDPKNFRSPVSITEVGNLAAEHLGHRLSLDPSDDPSAEQWKAYKEQLRRELKRRLSER